MNPALLCLAWLAAASEAEPRITFEVSGTRDTLSAQTRLSEPVTSLTDLHAQAWGEGALSASLNATVTLVIDQTSIAESLKARAIRVQTAMQTGQANVPFPEYEMGLPGQELQASSSPTQSQSIMVILPPSQGVVRVPLRLAVRAKGQASQELDSKRQPWEKPNATVFCRAAMLVSQVKRGSLIEAAALRREMTTYQLSGSLTKPKTAPPDSLTFSSPLPGRKGVRTLLAKEERAPIINDVKNQDWKPFSAEFHADGVSATYPETDLQKLAEAFWGPDWEDRLPDFRLRLRDLHFETWSYPLATLSPAVSAASGPVTLSVKLSGPGMERLEKMRPAEGTPPHLHQTEEEIDSQPYMGVRFTPDKSDEEMRWVQVYGVRLSLHTSGRLEAVTPSGRVLRSERILWRADRFTAPSASINIGMMMFEGGYSGGPFLTSELLGLR